MENHGSRTTRRRKIRRLAPIRPQLSLSVALLIGLLGCSKHLRLYTDYDPTVNFAFYSTFRWVEPATSSFEQRSAYDALLAQWVQQAVEQRLTAQGFRKTTSGPVDFLVTAGVHFEPKREVTRTYEIGPSVVRRRTWHGPLLGYYWQPVPGRRLIVETRTYEEGSVSLGILDPVDRHLVWMGGAAREVDSPKDDKTALQEAVEKILARFPPLAAPLPPTEATVP